MPRRKTALALTSSTALLALALACSSSPKSPLTPSGGTGSSSTAATDATLKVDAPKPTSPINDQQPNLLTLVASPAAGKFVAAGALQYNFEIYNAANVRMSNDTANGPTHSPTTVLEFGKRYTWRVRAVLNGATGPWSAAASFIAPAGGYNVPGELYDPLISGRTVGTIHGNVEFIPGVGVKLLDNAAYIDYELPAMIENGEISAIVANICSCSGQPGIKTKVFGMMEGYDDITTNERRFTIEKRSGADKGRVAFRVLAKGGDAETVGEERMFVDFNPAASYLWRATYNTAFRLTIDQLGGGNVYDFGKDYGGGYRPNPHVAFLGSPPPRAGVESGTVANMIIRQFWISSRPRPDAITQ